MPVPFLEGRDMALEQWTGLALKLQDLPLRDSAGL